MSGPSRLGRIKESLGLVPEEEALVRDAGRRLGAEIPGWVARFYGRLVRDPFAMELIGDEGRVQRLKRSLTAWLLEVLSLPIDEAYAQARADIGQAHVRIGMPAYLMVTTMGCLRRDVEESVMRVFGADPPEARRVHDAVGKVLDLELALMLEAYRRRVRELRQRRDRAIVAERIARRSARSTRDAVDTALCYAEILDRESTGARSVWTTRLQAALRRIASPSPDARPVEAGERRETRMDNLVMRALEFVTLQPRTAVEVVVEPPHLAARVHADVLQAAVEELLQQAADRTPGGVLRVAARATEEGVEIEIVDGSDGWPESARGVAEALGALAGEAGGVALAYAEHVADLHDGSVGIFRPPAGGAGTRLVLGTGVPRGFDARRDPDPRRLAP